MSVYPSVESASRAGLSWIHRQSCEDSGRYISMPGFSENGHESHLGHRDGEAFTMVSLWASDPF